MVGDEIGAALDRYLAACVRAALAQQSWPDWPFGADDTALVDRLADDAEYHGIALLLAQRGTAFAGWPAPATDVVRSLAHRAAFEESLRRLHLASLIEHLAKAGIAHRLLKGSALAYLFYSDPAARPRGDTDLLIAPQDLTPARRILGAAGWRREDTLHAFANQESWSIDCGAGMVHTLDLHWRMSNRAVLRRMLPEERFWATVCPLPRLSAHAAAPDPVLLLLHGAINQLWHQYRGFFLDKELVVGRRRLIWAVDTALICKALTPADWEQLIALCGKHDTAAILHAVLTGAQEDIGADVPADVLARLALQDGGSAMLDYIASPDARAEFLADLAASENLTMRARLIWSTAFASRSHLAGKYPEAAHWPTAALQARRYYEAARTLLGAEARRAKP